MSLVSGPTISREALLERDDDVLGVVDGKRGLGDIGDGTVGGNRQHLDIGFRLDQMHRRAHLAHGAFHFGMAGMADQDQGAAMGDITLALIVHFGDQRAGGVQHRQAARLRGLDHRLRHAMGGKHRHRAFGHFVQLFDKAGALALERVHHMAVMDDLMAHIDGLAELIERLFDDVDGAHHPGTKAARLGKNDSHISSFAGPSRAPSGEIRPNPRQAKPVSRIDPSKTTLPVSGPEPGCYMSKRQYAEAQKGRFLCLSGPKDQMSHHGLWGGIEGCGPGMHGGYAHHQRRR